MANKDTLAIAGAGLLDRVAEGVGIVRERTIEIGSRVIWIDNIGSLVILRGEANYVLALVGALLTMVGLALLQDDLTMAILLIGAGVGLVWLNLNQKVDNGLSIGTCDGRKTLVVSSNEHFLLQALDLIREKIETGSITLQGQFDIGATHVSSSGGGIIVGTRGVAGSAHGEVRPTRPVSVPVASAAPQAAAPRQVLRPVDNGLSTPTPTPAQAAPSRSPSPPAQPPRPSFESAETSRFEPIDPPRRGGSGVLWLVFVLLLAASAAGVAYLWWQGRAQETPPSATVTTEAPASSSVEVERPFEPSVLYAPAGRDIALRASPGGDGVIIDTVASTTFLRVLTRTTRADGAWLRVQRIAVSDGVYFEVEGQGFVSELEVRTTDLPTVVEAEGVTSVEPASLTGIIWLERPTAPDFARHYPPRALEQRIEARVELDCTSAADGRLSCSVASEEPKGWEFGDATLRLASLFRLAPTTRTGEASAGRSLRLPVMWRIQEAAAAVGPGEIEQPVVGELVTNPRWLEQPSARDFERHYPRDAAARGLEGRALLECSVLRDGRLNCSLVSEEPAGAGFGDAALRLSSSFRAAPTTVDGVATVGRRVRIPLLFRLAD